MITFAFAKRLEEKHALHAYHAFDMEILYYDNLIFVDELPRKLM
jgi:hypothetical protein